MHNYKPIADKDLGWDTSCSTPFMQVEPRPRSEAVPLSSSANSLQQQQQQQQQQRRPRFLNVTTRRPPIILRLPIAVGALLSLNSHLPSQQTDSDPISGNGAVAVMDRVAVAELESVWDGIEIVDDFENDMNPYRCPRYQDFDDEDDDDSDDEGDDDEYAEETIEGIDVYPDMASERQEGQEEDEEAGEALETLLDSIEDMAASEVSALVELIGLAQEELQNNLPGVRRGMGDALTENLLSGPIAEQERDANSIDHDDAAVVQEPAFLSLVHHRHHKVHSASRTTGEINKKAESGETEEVDEDERDHYPSHLGHGGDENDDIGNDETEDKDDPEDEEEDHGVDDEHDHERGGSKDKTKPPRKQKPKPKHNSHPDHNANLGGTGGNGPILLCSSRSCLPGLRDYILSKLSVQIHHVLSHLRNQQTLLYMMDSTAPQTKESLIAGQEDLVQQIEDQVIQDLKDWVNGVGRPSDTNKISNKSRPSEPTKTTSVPPTKPSTTATATATTTVSDPAPGDDSPGDDEEEDGVSTAEITVDFLADDDDGIYGGDEEDGFQMESLDLDDDEDDDDEDHEFDKSPALLRKKQQQQQQRQQRQQRQQQQAHQQPAKGFHKSSSALRLKKRDTAPAGSAEGGGNNNAGSTGSNNNNNNSNNNNNNNAHVYFLSADKALMRQEWSRWIAHWVHHAKLLILSHTLATRTVEEMNQIVVAGGNVVSQDQRHWAWNLDKALATVMVASEMLCGGPAQPKQVAEFLSTLSSPHSSGDPKQTQKSVDLTVNAQKCIEAWRADLEEVLKRTATVA
ncbi:hypothetical protein EC968_010631 [Mortierella alpina]|nr:hypothetical protein EC968_010631 [Mortierella alpina]